MPVSHNLQRENALISDIMALQKQCAAIRIQLDDIDPTWDERYAEYVANGLDEVIRKPVKE